MGVFRKSCYIRLKPLISPCQNQGLHKILIILGYAGTLDLVAGHPLTPGLVLNELKSTGYKIWPQAIADAELQAAAYALAWPHQFPDLPIAALAPHPPPFPCKIAAALAIADQGSLQQWGMEGSRDMGEGVGRKAQDNGLGRG